MGFFHDPSIGSSNGRIKRKREDSSGPLSYHAAVNDDIDYDTLSFGGLLDELMLPVAVLASHAGIAPRTVSEWRRGVVRNPHPGSLGRALQVIAQQAKIAGVPAPTSEQVRAAIRRSAEQRSPTAE